MKDEILFIISILSVLIIIACAIYLFLIGKVFAFLATVYIAFVAIALAEDVIKDIIKKHKNKK